MRIETIDLNFLGAEEIIASFLLLGDGLQRSWRQAQRPASTPSAGLKDHGVSFEDVDRVFLTHIHLDHAGASGHLADMLPNATFYVHEVGRPHLVIPQSCGRAPPASTAREWRSCGRDARAGGPPRSPLRRRGPRRRAACCGALPPAAYHHIAYLASSQALFAARAGTASPTSARIPPPEVDLGPGCGHGGDAPDLASQPLPDALGCFDDGERHLGELSRGCKLGTLRRGHGRRGGREEMPTTRRKATPDLAEGATPEESGRYDLAGDYSNLVDGLMRYVAKRRDRASE